MGAITQWFGLETSFYVIGAVGLIGLTLTTIWMARSPAFKKQAVPEQKRVSRKRGNTPYFDYRASRSRTFAA